MTCRHSPDDPDCTYRYARYTPIPEPPKTPDKANFEIEDVEEVGRYLILKVLYPNCVKCAYEGHKIMVMEATLRDALRWREIDPHFRINPQVSDKKTAPSPIARFPASDEGWEHAKKFVQLITGAR